MGRPSETHTQAAAWQLQENVPADPQRPTCTTHGDTCKKCGDPWRPKYETPVNVRRPIETHLHNNWRPTETPVFIGETPGDPYTPLLETHGDPCKQ